MRTFISAFFCVLCFSTTAVKSSELTVERLVGSPAISGPRARNVEISPDGSRVTWLQGRQDDQHQLDLWEYDIGSGKKRMLVDSVQLTGGKEQLDEVELARRERARIASSTGIVEYRWSPDG